MSAPGLRTSASMLALVAFVGLAAGWSSQDWFPMAWAGYPAVGWYVAVQKPTNRMGWLLLLVGLCWGGAAGLMPLAESSGSIWIEILSSQLSILGFTGMVMIPVLFPGGRSVGEWGTWMIRVLLVVVMLTLVSEVLGSDAKPSGRVSPIAIPVLSGPARFLQNEGFFIVPLILLMALFDLLARWRRSEGVERLQYRWFLTALAFVAPTLLVTSAVSDLPVWLVLATVNLLPASIGVAVLRYRLYEIDKIVSRTVSYGVVAAVIGGIYVVPVVTVPRLLGYSNDLVVAASTLAAAAAFTPVRRRVRRAVDLRFNRTRYDAEREVDAFSDKLRSNLTIGSIDSAFAETLDRTVQPATAALWIRERP